MRQFQKNDTGDDEQHRKNPHRACGVAVEKNPNDKGTRIPGAGPHGIGCPRGNVALGQEKQITADDHANP